MVAKISPSAPPNVMRQTHKKPTQAQTLSRAQKVSLKHRGDKKATLPKPPWEKTENKS